ncbi:hypothetical protein HU719_020450 [Pseudomonas sp. SWRI107]|uniref:hypothetical protein n=1 Tax=Pseudomonas farsensis TaxID=2745492 RepID=UPI001648888E|nr:hypothetical protein [Pseudomonas farsensis]
MMLAAKRNWMALALGLFISSPLFAAEAARPAVADKVDAFEGERGVQVWTMRVGERSANEALVQIAGADHDWDKRIQKMQVEKTGRDVRYATQVDGKKYVVLIVRGNSGELYLPGQDGETPLYYSAGLARQSNPEHFLTDYLEQQSAK